MELIAYKGDKKLKSDLLIQIKAHRKADQIKQGSYGTQNGTWKGCAVACSLRSLAIVKGEPLVEKYAEHERYETDLGIPRIVARLEDGIFEGLSVEKSKDFPLQFATAITPGADLKLVWPRFAVWLLTDKKDGVLQYAKTNEQRKAIQDVADAYERVIQGKEVSRDTWIGYRRAAYAAAYAAADAYAYAYAAADAYAYAAADAAADAAAYAAAAADADAAAYAADAAYAAYAAADAADAAYAAADARKIHYSKCAKKLIQILKETT